MATVAYLFHKNGSAVRESQRLGGRNYFFDAECRLEQEYKEGDTVSIHSGYGIFHEYRVEAIDNRSAILIRT